jgi:hypothetical protein
MSTSYECCTSEKRPVLYKDIYVLLVLLGRDLYDQNVQLNLKSYLPVVYGTPLKVVGSKYT